MPIETVVSAGVTGCRSDESRAGAAGRLLELIQARLISESIHVVAALGIADLLNDAPRSMEELARATGARAQTLQRVMRALSVFGIFEQTSDHRFTLRPMGEFLRRDVKGSLHSAALLFGGESGASTIQLLLECVKTGETAPHKLSGGNWIDWLLRDPERTERFNAVMTAFSELHFTGVMDAYNFSYARTLVDVGGGHGKIISEILKRTPALRGVLFDMPHAFEGGKTTIAQSGLDDRCEVVTGDFFVSVPAGADAYLLSRVIHDWDDLQAVSIFKNIRAVIAPQGRLVLLECMLRQGEGTVYPVLSDLNMLLMTGGRERTEEEYKALYRAAGFELTQTIATSSPTGTTLIEGRPV